MTHVYFTDRDLGKKFPERLRAASITVERHLDLFRHDAPDEVWLEHCGRNGRIALSHNLRIRYTPNELAAVKDHGVSLIILIGKVPLPQLADNFVYSLSRIEAFIDRREPPYIAKLYRPSLAELAKNPGLPGSIKPWFPAA